MKKEFYQLLVLIFGAIGIASTLLHLEDIFNKDFGLIPFILSGFIWGQMVSKLK